MAGLLCSARARTMADKESVGSQLPHLQERIPGDPHICRLLSGKRRGSQPANTSQRIRGIKGEKKRLKRNKQSTSNRRARGASLGRVVVSRRDQISSIEVEQTEQESRYPRVQCRSREVPPQVTSLGGD
ncbi:mucin-5AC [Platysternon megacephalum]|uniref:Mucin-5AC n=1 Tax=Platysternon megacephalum TaxID=55544 RepID=A0A4D9EEQ7_9SAUR|nr:mucin-5AC [Platysternon megacephalum]